MSKNKEIEIDERSVEILEAALRCFLKFGYSKTSLEDIALEAGRSRTLLYLKFKDKKAIYRETFRMLTEPTRMKFSEIAKNEKNKRKLLLSLYEVSLLEAWDKISSQPMFEEFYETCEKICPDLSEQHEHYLQNQVAKILNSKHLAEVFCLSIIGLYSDLPDNAVLKKRIITLIDKFID